MRLGRLLNYLRASRSRSHRCGGPLARYSPRANGSPHPTYQERGTIRPFGSPRSSRGPCTRVREGGGLCTPTITKTENRPSMMGEARWHRGRPWQFSNIPSYQTRCSRRSPEEVVAGRALEAAANTVNSLSSIELQGAQSPSSRPPAGKRCPNDPVFEALQQRKEIRLRPPRGPRREPRRKRCRRPAPNRGKTTQKPRSLNQDLSLKLTPRIDCCVFGP